MSRPHSNRAASAPQQGLSDRLRAGDPGAAAELERTYRTSLVRFAFGYLGDAAEAEDAAQDVFVKALSTKSAPAELRPWLYRITRNHCLNLLRHRRVRAEERLPSRAAFMDSEAGHLTRLVNAENEEAMRARVAALTPEHREVLELRYGEDLSREEIAQVLDLAPSVVKSRLFEAMKKLRAAS